MLPDEAEFFNKNAAEWLRSNTRGTNHVLFAVTTWFTWRLWYIENQISSWMLALSSRTDTVMESSAPSGSQNQHWWKLVGEPIRTNRGPWLIGYFGHYGYNSNMTAKLQGIYHALLFLYFLLMVSFFNAITFFMTITLHLHLLSSKTISIYHSRRWFPTTSFFSYFSFFYLLFFSSALLLRPLRANLNEI